jgi:hypothetical protein
MEGLDGKASRRGTSGEMSAKIAVLGLVIEEPGPAHRLTAKLRQRLSSAGFVDSNVYSALTRLERDGLVRAVDKHATGTLVVGRTQGRSLGLAQETAYRARHTGTRALYGGADARRIGAREQADVEEARGGEKRTSGGERTNGRELTGGGEQNGGGRRAAGRVDPGAQGVGSGLAHASARRSPGSRTDSRSFEATPAGVQHFEEWLLGSSTAPPFRDELHMKVALCQPHNLPRLVELVYWQELVCLARVRDLKQSLERVRPPAPERWSGLVQVHIRDAELSFWDARLTWLQGVRESLEGMHAEYERAIRRRSED